MPNAIPTESIFSLQKCIQWVKLMKDWLINILSSHNIQFHYWTSRKKLLNGCTFIPSAHTAVNWTVSLQNSRAEALSLHVMVRGDAAFGKSLGGSSEEWMRVGLTWQDERPYVKRHQRACRLCTMQGHSKEAIGKPGKGLSQNPTMLAPQPGTSSIQNSEK